jgi:hypothetical protein
MIMMADLRSNLKLVGFRLLNFRLDFDIHIVIGVREDNYSLGLWDMSADERCRRISRGCNYHRHRDLICELVRMLESGAPKM